MPDRAERKLCRTTGKTTETQRAQRRDLRLLNPLRPQRLCGKNPNKLFLENCTEKASKAM
ncbi:hypothetical protein FTV88_2690 [Heliorestis convoluta]|uniref:Uncharacterized protein n=1 Tax=Heliorestis convoluta TaxID=356322 RepID=A0A5Q2N4G5_9FIRM|nr:hypothetical protein FTV88_2690 [Heliorestis convoluta]